MGLVLTLAQAREEQAKLRDDQKRGKIAFLQKRDIIGQLTQQKGELETALDQVKSERVDVEVVTKVAEWFSTKNALLATKETLKKDAKTVADDEEKLEMSKINRMLVRTTRLPFRPRGRGHRLPPNCVSGLTGEKQALVSQHAEVEKDILRPKTQREAPAVCGESTSG